MTSRTTFHWRPGQSSLERRAEGDLRAVESHLESVLADAVEDRLSTAEGVLRRVSEAILAWARVAMGDTGLTWPRIERLVRGDLASFNRAQGWRGPVARWFAALSGLEREAGTATPGEALIEELGLWLGGAGADANDGTVWDGRALAPGPRLPRRGALCPELYEGVTQGETIALISGSVTAQHALIEVHERGLAPHVLLPEGAPLLWGRRVAARLIGHGIGVTLTYDAAFQRNLGRVDRLWTGTEAIGAAAFLGPAGAAAWFDEARRLELPTCLVSTSDKLMPAGELRLPPSDPQDRWLLWDEAPDAVRLETQAFEPVSLDRIDGVACELGLLGAGQLALRALVTEPSPALDGWGPTLPR